MTIPSAILFINNDLTDALQTIIVEQIRVNEVMTKEEFDARVKVDPNYPTIIHLNHLRILVKLSDFHDYVNRDKADVVMFLKQGLLSIEKSNFGPPGLTLPLDRLNLYALLRYNNSSEVTILPTTPTTRSSALGGIFTILSTDPSGVHDANTDNEANNEDFINRK